METVKILKELEKYACIPEKQCDCVFFKPYKSIRHYGVLHHVPKNVWWILLCSMVMF